MPRNYVRTSDRKKWHNKDMVAAISDILHNVCNLHAAAIKYKIPDATLRRYFAKRVHLSGEEEIKVAFPENLGRFKKAVSSAQSEEQTHYVIDIEKRARGLNRSSVKNFFELLREVRLKYSFAAHEIYNADETEFSIAATKTLNTVSSVGICQEIKIPSTEPGVTVTCVCAINGIGNFVPPFFIYPRAKMHPTFIDGAPPGSAAVPHISGRMTAPNFVEYLKHFAYYTRPNKQQPILLLVDNHGSHVTDEAVEFCREKGIVLVGFPPHTSHKLQPLEVGFYGPLKMAYSRACDNFQVSNPGVSITISHIPKLFCNAYYHVASLRIAINAFQVTGMQPFDNDILREEDFEPTDLETVEEIAPVFVCWLESSCDNSDSSIPPTAGDSQPMEVGSAISAARRKSARNPRLTEKVKKKKAHGKLAFSAIPVSAGDNAPSRPALYIYTDEEDDDTDTLDLE